jgi:EamA-like transporter family
MNSGGRQLGWAALIVAMASWGSVVVTMKIATRGLPVQTITLIEVGSAILLLGAVVLHRQTRLARPSRMVVLAGLLEPVVSYPLIKRRSGPEQRDARVGHRRD